MKEVICINDDWDASDPEDQGPCPKLHEICIVEGSLYDGVFNYYFLKGYDRLDKNNERDCFQSIMFADITSLSKEIQEALKAKTPKKKLKIITTPLGLTWCQKWLDDYEKIFPKK